MFSIFAVLVRTRLCLISSDRGLLGAVVGWLRLGCGPRAGLIPSWSATLALWGPHMPDRQGYRDMDAHSAGKWGYGGHSCTLDRLTDILASQLPAFHSQMTLTMNWGMLMESFYEMNLRILPTVIIKMLFKSSSCL